MVCDRCGNTAATRLSYRGGNCSCEVCGKLGKFRFSDVYFKGNYFDENIVDPVKHPFGMEITSREHKADVLRANGLRETGDKRHGSRSPF